MEMANGRSHFTPPTMRLFTSADCSPIMSARLPGHPTGSSVLVMPRIAHISDIHFGKTFDVEVWKNVRQRIEEFNPDLLVVSGDLVDHPWPFRLLAVKAELLNLCKRCRSEPELFVVPGNHDVTLWGNVRLRLWPWRLSPRWLQRIMPEWWFERIMFSDTQRAQDRIRAALGISVGLNEECKRFTWRRRFRRLIPEGSIRRNVKEDACDKRLQSRDWRSNGRRWPTENLHSRISIVCFDSNPAEGFAFASGEVEQPQLTRLDHGRRSERIGPMGAPVSTETVPPPQPISEDRGGPPKASMGDNTGTPLIGTSPPPTHEPPTLIDSDRRTGDSRKVNGAAAVLLRIAVLHHHPLPIALSAESFPDRKRGSDLEPYLVLRNSGDLLRQLQQHKFDLVLHGHKHRSQFARLELNADGVDPYPLTVLGAGSTAKADEARANNTLRLIETEPNGRLVVRTIECGEAWGDDEEPYREELSKLKQRAFSRARELTKRTAALMRFENRIDPVGHVYITTEVRKLRLLRGAEAVNGFPFLIGLPAHGQRIDDLVQLYPEFRDAMRVKWRAKDERLYDLDHIPENQHGHYWIELKQILEPGSSRTINYRIDNAVANSIAMNSWVLAKQARADHRDYEYVWRYVAYPIDRLVLRLVLPENLGDVRPEFRCRRAPSYPEFPLTFLPDVAMEAVVKSAEKRSDFDLFEVDEDLQREEQHKLRYHPDEMAWELDIEYPVPGYIYELRWKVPVGDVADRNVLDGTNVRQNMLCKFRDRLRQNSKQVREGGTDPKLSDLDQGCSGLFEEFAETLMKELVGVDPEERQAIFLMVYDPSDSELHPVYYRLSWGAEPPKSFSVPMGRGIAGAAFLQGKVLAWGKGADRESLIRPVPLPGIDPHYVLALPIFYPGDFGLVVKTGAVIGVVTVASDSPGSRISDCRGDTEQAAKRRTEVQLGAQAVVMEILERLSRHRSRNAVQTVD